MKSLIVYVHGFASTGGGDKYHKLQAKYGNVISPTFSSKVSEAINQIDELIKSNLDKSIIFVGTSLGGFYSYYAHCVHGCKAVLVNPLIRVADATMLLGIHDNYVTGERFEFTKNDLDNLYKVYDQIQLSSSDDKHNCLVFLGNNDTILDSKYSEKYFEFYPLTITESDHRFSDFEIVVESIEKIL